MYIVRIDKKYLSRGRLVKRENATRYYHPSGARAALHAFVQKHPSRHELKILNEKTGRHMNLWQKEPQ